MIRAEQAIAALGVSLIVAACVGHPTQLEQAAMRVRAAQSPYIREVIYRDENLLDPERAIVYLVPSATARDAESVWCTVLLPVGITDENAVLWADNGMDFYAPPTSCSN